MMRASMVIITGDQRRHSHFANRLVKEFDAKGIVAEAVYQPQVAGDLNDVAVVSQHFMERDEAERRDFAAAARLEIDERDIFHVSTGEANSPCVFQWIHDRHPEYLAL